MIDNLVLYYSADGLVRRWAELIADGSTPYGASHFAGLADNLPIADSERPLSIGQGDRPSEPALGLAP